MSVKQFAVLGAGVMGSGIAYQASLCGIPTRLVDLSDEALKRAERQITNLLQRQLERQRIDQVTLARAQSCLVTQNDQAGFGQLDLLVEAVVESEQIKLAVLQQTERTLATDAVLTTNTSTISIDRLAGELERPERFCGLHFFNPVAQMQLVEVIQGTATSEQTLETCVEFALSLGKKPVVVRDCPGFLVNRVLFPYFHGFDLLVKEGVAIERIDSVMETFGWPMGPAYLADLIGMDVMVGADRVLQEGYPERMAHKEPSVFEKLLEVGQLGQKTGSGFYSYSQNEKGERLREPNVDLLSNWGSEASSISDEDIFWRMMLPMLTESLRALDESVIKCSDDLQLAAALGLGFPQHQEGGLWGYIESIGRLRLQQLLARYSDLGGLYQYD